MAMSNSRVKVDASGFCHCSRLKGDDGNLRYFARTAVVESFSFMEVSTFPFFSILSFNFTNFLVLPIYSATSITFHLGAVVFTKKLP